jgi:hypothetical protein
MDEKLDDISIGLFNSGELYIDDSLLAGDPTELVTLLQVMIGWCVSGLTKEAVSDIQLCVFRTQRGEYKRIIMPSRSADLQGIIDAIADTKDYIEENKPSILETINIVNINKRAEFLGRNKHD